MAPLGRSWNWLPGPSCNTWAMWHLATEQRQVQGGEGSQSKFPFEAYHMWHVYIDICMTVLGESHPIERVHQSEVDINTINYKLAMERTLLVVLLHFPVQNWEIHSSLPGQIARGYRTEYQSLAQEDAQKRGLVYRFLAPEYP